MAKTVAGVKYGKLTSKKKERTYPAAPKKGRSGPNTNAEHIGNKSGPKKTPFRFASKSGSVSSARKSHTGDPHPPKIGSQKGHGGFASLGIRR